MRRSFFATIVLTIALGCSVWFCGTEDGENGVVGDRTDDDAAGELSQQEGEMAEELNPALLIPSLAREEAPAEFKVEFETTKGPFVIQSFREWSPLGVNRFYNLVKIGYFNDVAFFRAIEGFVVQFGVSGIPEVNQSWANAFIKDEPPKASNKRSFVTFAMAGPNSRTTQLFINLVDNVDLDSRGFAPIGKVIEQMAVVDSLHTGYGEMAPRGKGPRASLLNLRGNEYLKAKFPNLDYVKVASILSQQ
jgi:peptidyl-prolyl cis-trans isomerase A (cyclophilin A)